ncbi:DUF397 domain-containing protein [Actinocorallia herbida]|uniref:DUF397 domain-containing protein n=1 Tax=Actinocorallia herbida TaxID=58109 RepID=UPI000F4CA176
MRDSKDPDGAVLTFSGRVWGSCAGGSPGRDASGGSARWIRDLARRGFRLSFGGGGEPARQVLEGSAEFVGSVDGEGPLQ